MDERVRRVVAKVAGADLTLRARLSESAIAAFEARHNVRLPEEYRLFLLEAGDGGAGPHYGIERLESSLLWEEQEDGFLAAPSHFEPDSERAADWYADLPEPLQGTLAFCSEGCADWTVLVVSGPARGRLFSLNLDWNATPRAIGDPDFLAWYERWLDELPVV